MISRWLSFRLPAVSGLLLALSPLLAAQEAGKESAPDPADSPTPIEVPGDR